MTNTHNGYSWRAFFYGQPWEVGDCVVMFTTPSGDAYRYEKGDDFPDDILPNEVRTLIDEYITEATELETKALKRRLDPMVKTNVFQTPESEAGAREIWNSFDERSRELLAAVAGEYK